MENKPSFLLYKSFYEPIKDLSLEEKGQLLDAIFQYQLNPENPLGSLGSGVKIAFNFITNQFKLDEEKYQKKVEANQKNGLKGGRPKTHWVISKPKKADKEKEKGKDKVVAIEKSLEEYKQILESYGKNVSISNNKLYIDNKQIVHPELYIKVLPPQNIPVVTKKRIQSAEEAIKEQREFRAKLSQEVNT